MLVIFKIGFSMNFYRVKFRPAIPCNIVAVVPKVMGNSVSYVDQTVTTDLIDIDREIYNDLDAQLSAHADLTAYNVSDLLSSQDASKRDLDAQKIVSSVIDSLEANDINPV